MEYANLMLFSKIKRSKEMLLKVGILLSKKICVICFIDSTLKMIKNAFYLVLNALFVLKIFKFLS